MAEGKQGASFSVAFAQMLEGLGAVGVVYNLAANSFNSVSSALSVAPEATALPVFFTVGIEWGGIIGDLILGCIAIGFITYVILKLVCGSEWVQEPVDVKECWEETKWYNPWSWVKSIVCTVKEVLKWVLKEICRWKAVATVLRRVRFHPQSLAVAPLT